MLVTAAFIGQIGLFLAGWFGPLRDASTIQSNCRLTLGARMLLSFSLVAVALLIWLGNFSRVPVYGQWVAFGMTASFVGDMVMARLIPFPNRLVGGMLAFGIAHWFYISAYTQTIQTISSLEPYARFNIGLVVGLVVYGAVAILGWWLMIRNPARGTVINIGALAYGLWIGVMASFAAGLAYALPPFWLTAVGGLLFVISDFIVGVTDIRGIEMPNGKNCIWLTYIAGQMGIVYAGFFAF